MPSRLTILATTAIATLVLAAPAALAKSGGRSMGMSSHPAGMSMGSHPSMGMGMAHMGGMHHHHHGRFFFGSVGYDPYYADYDGFYDDDSCPLVHRRVQTQNGLRWRTVRACAY